MPDETKHILSNLTKHQFGTLKFINDHEVTLAYLRKAHATTLFSLIYRGYLRKVGGSSDNAQVFLTELGVEALKNYTAATMNERVREREMTERCLRLLQHARRVAVMTKSA